MNFICKECKQPCKIDAPEEPEWGFPCLYEHRPAEWHEYDPAPEPAIVQVCRKCGREE